MSSVMIAFTFPGQGSQAPAMGEPWRDLPSWELVAEASEAVDRDVEHLLLRADADELRQTRNSQLATYVLSMVALDAVERIGIQPAFVAGHSLGEYSALTAAGVLSFSAGVRLVGERGDAMQAAADAQVGTMAAVLGLDDDKVVEACEGDDDVWVANYNAPGQVVIAGNPAAIERAGNRARELGAKRVLPIKVGGAFHTPYMAPASERLRKTLAETEMREANIAVFTNLDAAPKKGPAEWRGLLASQLISPVQWRRTLHALDQAGTTVFLELGPGTALTGMVKRTIKKATSLAVNTPADVDNLLENLSHASSTGRVADGELLYAIERLVVSPVNGVFSPIADLEVDASVQAGQLVGHVGPVEVRSLFEGSLQGLLALDGERVTVSQPLAWLRAPTVGRP